MIYVARFLFALGCYAPKASGFMKSIMERVGAKLVHLAYKVFWMRRDLYFELMYVCDSVSQWACDKSGDML